MLDLATRSTKFSCVLTTEIWAAHQLGEHEHEHGINEAIYLRKAFDYARDGPLNEGDDHISAAWVIVTINDTPHRV